MRLGLCGHHQVFLFDDEDAARIAIRDNKIPHRKGRRWSATIVYPERHPNHTRANALFRYAQRHSFRFRAKWCHRPLDGVEDWPLGAVDGSHHPALRLGLHAAGGRSVQGPLVPSRQTTHGPSMLSPQPKTTSTPLRRPRATTRPATGTRGHSYTLVPPERQPFRATARQRAGHSSLSSNHLRPMKSLTCSTP